VLVFLRHASDWLSLHRASQAGAAATDQFDDPSAHARTFGVKLYFEINKRTTLSNRSGSNPYLQVITSFIMKLRKKCTTIIAILYNVQDQLDS
jgi:hypothetical protein